MMNNKPSIGASIDSIIPITRFNRGEASKIFDEVNACGIKVVLRNNAVVCVLIQPERYDAMVEALEDYALYFEAEHRTKAAGANTVTHAEVIKELGICEDNLRDVEAEIE